MMIKKCILILLAFTYISISNAQTFSGATGIIPDDLAFHDYNITVSGLPNTMTDSFGLVRICIDITHTWVSDLEIYIVAPSGDQITLASQIGGAGDDFTSTCFLQTASTLISSSSPPFTGTFKPFGNIGNFNNGQNPNGIWKLKIRDAASQDIGFLNSCSIKFDTNAPGPYVFPGSNLPLVVINTVASIVDDPKVIGNMRIINNVSGFNQATDSAAHYSKIGIEIRGNYSSSLPQKPYGFETLDSTNLELDIPLLGMPAEHDWIFMATYNDKAFCRNSLANDLFRDMGHYASRGKLCEVIINGNYQGVYYLCEAIKRDNDRVNIAKLSLTDTSGINVTGGYIFKNDFGTGWTSNYHPIGFPTYNINFAYHYPKSSNILPQQATYLQSFVAQAESALYSTTFKDTALGYLSYFDMNSFYDYFIINELSRNNDGFKKSVYFHKGKNSATSIGKIKMGPVWDFDWAWKNIDECVYGANDGSQWVHLINNCGPDNPSAAWYLRLLQDSNFANNLHCRYVSLRQNVLDTNRIYNYIDSIANYANLAQARHYSVWNNLGYSSGAPENDSFPTTYIGEVSKLKKWISKRVIWLDQNMFGNANNCIVITGTPKVETKFIVFPNPTQDVVYIETPIASGVLQLNDFQGKALMNHNFFNKEIHILDLSKYTFGVYQLRVLLKDGTVINKKIIKN